MTLTDTGPLVALVNKNDPNPTRCVAATKRLSAGPLVTTWPCFTEAMYLLFQAGGYPAQAELWRWRTAGRLVLHDLTGGEVDRMAVLVEPRRWIMAEQATIKADQVEGLPDLILEKVREVIREEIKPVPEDMDKLRRSPAGTMIRLEEQVKALDMKMDQRFEVVDQRFEVVDQRFAAVDQRFTAVDQKIEGLKSEMERRFSDLKESMDHQFSSMKWILALIFPLLLTILGKLFLIK